MVQAHDQTAHAAPVAIAIHGGAGTLLRSELSAEKEAAIRADLEAAVRAGYALLTAGGDSLDAVSTAIQQLENSPHFNAAKGAVLNEDGAVELDASIMRGSDRNAGAVAGVHGVRNPIVLARAVMEHSPHVLLAGEGAETFARSQNIEFADEAYFLTPYRREQWQRLKSDRAELAGYRDSWFSTVGAVALDRHGHLAAGTSTGGMALKRWGRIGDSPLIGAGTYADDRYCAISATGHGEYFIRAAVAHDICARVRDRGVDIVEAARQVVMDDLAAMGGDGGVIAVGADGQVAMPFNTAGMYRAAIHSDGRVEVAIFTADQEADSAP
ncbi:MAG: isoaspartyl peptidase/L-asparaginase [Wenzhouxiangellaceae bacterium]